MDGKRNKIITISEEEFYQAITDACDKFDEITKSKIPSREDTSVSLMMRLQNTGFALMLAEMLFDKNNNEDIKEDM